MKRILQPLAIAVFLLLGQMALIASPMLATPAHAAIDVPDITTTSNDPGKAVKTLGIKIADSILIALTGICVVAIAAFFIMLAAGKPFPRFLYMPIGAAIGATSIGWLLKLIFGG